NFCQLTREVKRNGAGTVIHDTSYAHDLAQNRTSMTNHLTSSTTSYTYNSMNQMLTAGNVSFTYDANGNTVSRTVGGQTTTYTWDYENKLTQITYPNGTANTFTTNADGVRMTANDSGGHRRFIYDGSSVVSEQDIASGNFVVVYDHGNSDLVRQTRGTTASYYQFDGLGSTRQLTNASQAVTDTTSYDAWGNVLSSSGTTANPFKYVGSLGYYADADNGMMLLGARYYSAGIGRFSSLDPMRDSYNWYAYVGNKTTGFVDPSGLQEKSPPISLPPTGKIGNCEYTIRVESDAIVITVKCGDRPPITIRITRDMIGAGGKTGNCEWEVNTGSKTMTVCCTDRKGKRDCFTINYDTGRSEIDIGKFKAGSYRGYPITVDVSPYTIGGPPPSVTLGYRWCSVVWDPVKKDVRLECTGTIKF
ncbi:MAG: hypothetical protein NZT92_10205, partial [Abditibacteriales bacterium]|nr:hypothetical protein [Abditibacteriales bacterium]